MAMSVCSPVAERESNAVKERRLRILPVDPQLVVDMLQSTAEFVWRAKHDQLPADALILAVDAEIQYRAINVLIASMSFEPVAGGDRIPRLDQIEYEAVKVTRDLEYGSEQATG